MSARAGRLGSGNTSSRSKLAAGVEGGAGSREGVGMGGEEQPRARSGLAKRALPRQHRRARRAAPAAAAPPGGQRGAHRPGRRSAPSSASTRLVAPMTTTCRVVGGAAGQTGVRSISAASRPPDRMPRGAAASARGGRRAACERGQRTRRVPGQLRAARAWPRESRPSMSASSVDTIELWIWSCLLLRTCARRGAGVQAGMRERGRADELQARPRAGAAEGRPHEAALAGLGGAAGAHGEVRHATVGARAPAPGRRSRRRK